MHESSCRCEAAHYDSHVASQLTTSASSCVYANTKPDYKAGGYDIDVSVAFLWHLSCMGKTGKEIGKKSKAYKQRQRMGCSRHNDQQENWQDELTVVAGITPEV